MRTFLAEVPSEMIITSLDLSPLLPLASICNVHGCLYSEAPLTCTSLFLVLFPGSVCGGGGGGGMRNTKLTRCGLKAHLTHGAEV